MNKYTNPYVKGLIRGMSSSKLLRLITNNIVHFTYTNIRCNKGKVKIVSVISDRIPEFSWEEFLEIYSGGSINER